MYELLEREMVEVIASTGAISIGYINAIPAIWDGTYLQIGGEYSPAAHSFSIKIDNATYRCEAVRCEGIWHSYWFCETGGFGGFRFKVEM